MNELLKKIEELQEQINQLQKKIQPPIIVEPGWRSVLISVPLHKREFFITHPLTAEAELEYTPYLQLYWMLIGIDEIERTNLCPGQDILIKLPWTDLQTTEEIDNCREKILPILDKLVVLNRQVIVELHHQQTGELLTTLFRGRG